MTRIWLFTVFCQQLKQHPTSALALKTKEVNYYFRVPKLIYCPGKDQTPTWIFYCSRVSSEMNCFSMYFQSWVIFILLALPLNHVPSKFSKFTILTNFRSDGLQFTLCQLYRSVVRSSSEIQSDGYRTSSNYPYPPETAGI